jgi:glycolate oxidase FAD binding subunit
MDRVSPSTPDKAAAALRDAAGDGKSVRIRGGGTKAAWGRPAAQPDLELSTDRLDRLVAHDAGDLTARAQAGVPLARLQAVMAEKGQRLALDPPNPGARATLGGVVATGDSGPLRHRFGAPRDLVLGVTVALSDGTLAHAGGRVIKNVAGYELGKLFSGSFGTLGLVVEVCVRLHPLPPATATARLLGDDPAALAAAAATLAHSPLELEGLDLAWGASRGAVLARFAGTRPAGEARAGLDRVTGTGLDGDVLDEDEPLWDAQAAHQRSREGTVVRVSATQSLLPEVVRAAAGLGATVAGRAGLGLLWVSLPPAAPAQSAAAVRELRERLAGAPCVVQDAPSEVRAALDPWHEPPDGPRASLMRRVKQRFDPPGVMSPGVYAAGI